GVTMRLIDQVLDERATSAPVAVGQLADVDAVFATNAAVGIRTINAIDDIEWPDTHPVLDILRKQYAAIPAELV
ncbi:MAG: aminotransferase, partial [Pseudonocardiaceae bacterium]